MRPSRLCIIAPFCLAVAFIGAAIADPLVEALSNAGVFGPGNYTDHSMVDVIPALAIGLTAATVWLLIEVRKLLGRPVCKPRWLSRSLRALDAQCIAKMYPVIFAVQLVILFSMETLEQIAVYGHVIGLLIWLGGPIAVSLLAHALVCACATFILHRVTRKCAAAIVVIGCFIARLFAVRAVRANDTLTISWQAISARVASPLPCRIGGRAPPLPA